MENDIIYTNTNIFLKNFKEKKKSNIIILNLKINKNFYDIQLEDNISIKNENFLKTINIKENIEK